MKKLILISILCAFSTLALLSQTSDQLVRIKRYYYMNDKKLNGKEIQTILKSEPESAVLLKKSKTNSTIGFVSISAATVFIIYAALNPPAEEEGGLPGMISDEEMKKWMVPVYCSLGCLAVGIPFLLSGNKQFKKSVVIYNSKHTATGFRNEMKMDIGITPYGVGIYCKF
jgi:hypothetical protein